MKKVILVLMLAFAFSLNAQVVKVSVPIYSQKQVYRSAGDSSSIDVTLGYTGTSTQIAPGQYPDSIYISAFSNADSLALAFRVRAKVSGSTVYSNTAQDSIVASVGVATNKVFKLSPTSYNGFDIINIALTASNVLANTGSTTPSTVGKMTAKLVLFYKSVVYRP